MSYKSFSEFKNDLHEVRDKSRIIKAKIKSLETLRDDKLADANSGAIDYSKLRVQMSHDPDKALVYVLDDIERDSKKLILQIEKLKEEIAPTAELIEKRMDIGGEILRLYFLEGLRMVEVAKRVSYSESRTWELWRKTIRDIYEKEFNKP